MSQYFKAYDLGSGQLVEHSFQSNFGLGHACDCETMEANEIASIIDDVASVNYVDVTNIMLVGDYGIYIWYEAKGIIRAVERRSDQPLYEVFNVVWGS